MNLNAEKSRIRKEVANQWRVLKDEGRLFYSTVTFRKIKEIKEFLAAGTVLVYASQPEREIDFVADLMREFPEKTYGFPSIVSDTKIDFFAVETYQDLVRQKFGILSPPPNSPSIKEKPDFAFVPAVACDKNGNRLGRGAGFYDRYLENQPHLYKVCVLPHFAEYKKIPTEKWDQKVNQVLFINTQISVDIYKKLPY